jgi:hypothetical protein
VNPADIPNWHRYLLGFLMALSAVCAAIVAGVVEVPPGLKDIAPYAGIVGVFITAFLPRFQLPTGEGAPPILSPPPKS